MANKQLFKSTRGKTVPKATATNQAGGAAYEYTAEHALAQLACTGTFSDTFYGKAQDQLTGLRKAAAEVSDEFLAKVGVYAREKGYMKDMPAAIAVILSSRNPVLLDKVFDRVIDNGKQVRNFVQLTRSGAFGRKSLGSGPSRLLRRWFESRSDYALFRASVGNDPSLADVIKLVRPKAPLDSERANLYAYLLGCEAMKEGQGRVTVTEGPNGKPRKVYRYDPSKLPQIVKQYEAFKAGDRSGGVPNVDFRMLTSLPLTKEDWKAIALNGQWHETRMNLNTYQRHGVLEDRKVVSALAQKLKDADQIRKARAFPYQLLAAYMFATDVDVRLRNALQDAMEVATENVPSYDGNVYVVVDVSGSMTWGAVTGNRGSASSKIRPIDVAALVGSTVLRKNSNAVVLPVDTSVHSTSAINPRDSIMTNAAKLARFGGGGTDLGAAMRHIETKRDTPDLIIMVSDNESWVRGSYRGHGTGTQASFNKMKAKNPNLKMVCIDTTANNSSQTVQGCPSIMNIGGFSDTVWKTIAQFVDNSGPDQWVEEIRAISLD